MISVEDLRKWADEHAIGRSPSYPRGWVSARDGSYMPDIPFIWITCNTCDFDFGAEWK